MRKLATLSSLLASAVFATQIHAQTPAPKKDQYASFSMLTQGSHEQYILDTDLNAPVPLSWGVAVQRDDTRDFSLALRVAHDFGTQHLHAEPYLLGLASTSFSQPDKLDNISAGVRLGYKFSRRIRCGVDIRLAHYFTGPDLVMTGLYLSGY